MRKLAIILSLAVSLFGMTTLQAQEDLSQGEALLAAQLPDGVTLETATEAQIRSAYTNAMSINSGNADALSALSSAVSSSPRVANKPSATYTASVTMAVLGNIVTSNAIRQSVSLPTRTIVDPEQAATVIQNIISRTNISLTDLNGLINGYVASVNSLASSSSTFEDQSEYINRVANQLRTTAAQTIADRENQVCTTSNSVVTCVPA